jgi:hypothetical protein
MPVKEVVTCPSHHYAEVMRHRKPYRGLHLLFIDRPDHKGGLPAFIREVSDLRQAVRALLHLVELLEANVFLICLISHIHSSHILLSPKPIEWLIVW